MSRKAFSTFLLIGIFVAFVSFTSGTVYERWQESKSTLDFNHSLALLLASPEDFEITGSQWSSIEYTQIHYEPSKKGAILEYEVAIKHFSTDFPETHAKLNITHEIKRYAPAELPKTTWIDSIYFEKEANTEMEVRLLNLEKLDKNSRAFCVFSKVSTSIDCYIESKYKEIISIFAFYGYNMEESKIINFITPALQKLYYRFSKSPFK